jgi:hypothetical protein
MKVYPHPLITISFTRVMTVLSTNLSFLHLEQKGHKLDTLEILEIARAHKVGKALLNKQFEFNIFPLLAIARDYNWG